MLKALELAGFKSFADKTRFEFHSGITVVVGPNGSGKSNVVDAIKWVLGSQSPKSLRGSEMTDVIFNGSGSRGGLNTAEVSLILDNRQKLYPSDAQEISLTRRVYRSGEGEYLINGALCRLKDIRELLAGTGIGTEAYSIIEQGKVDALLQASPRDRRAIFEEAAGISRFRAKRQEAARRLARVEQNLLRLSDIVDEVESRLRSVRQQAGKAQRYREAARRLKELRTELGIADWWQIADRLAVLTAEESQFAAADAAQRQAVEQSEEELPKIDAEMAHCEGELQQIDAQLAVGRETLATCKATGRGLAERRLDLAARLTALEEEAAAAAGVELPEAAPYGSADQLAQLEEEIGLAVESRTRADWRQRQLAEHLERSRQRFEELRQRLVESTRQAALAEQEAQHLERQLQTEAERRGQLEAQRGAIETSHEASQKATAHLEQRATEASEHLRQAEQSVRDAQRQLAHWQQQLAEAQRGKQQLEQQLATLEHRRELLGEFDRERRAQMEEVHRALAPLYGTLPTLAELLHVDVDTASLIESALGALAEYTVVPNVRPLLESGAPAGTLLLERDHHTPPSTLDHIDLSSLPGVWGRADRFVEVAPEYAPLVRRLLGRTWIVDTLATAHQLASSHGKGLSFVTADGEVLTAEGALRVPARQGAQGGLTRAGEADRLAHEIERLRPKVDQARQQTEALETGQQELAQEVEKSLALQSTASQALAEFRQQLATSAAETNHLRSQLQQLECDLAAASAHCEQLSRERTKLAEASEAQLTERRELADACQRIEQVLAVADIEAQEARESLQRAELTVLRLTQEREIVRGAALVAQEQGRVQERRQQLALEIEQVTQRLADLDREVATNSAAEAKATAALERLNPERAAAVAKLEEARQRRTQLLQTLQQARRTLDSAQARRNQVEVAIAKLDHQRQTLVERLREEHDIDLPGLVHQRPADTANIDRKQMEQEIEELRTTLTRIGNVNVDALEELDQIEMRYEAISGQYRDLSQAKAGLEKLMNRLNTESRQLFLATVETVRGHFQELFRRLFGGGEADIVLEFAEGDDAMECGVEIRACPPGKETRNISLLSGGEKTMTCVALLLAMFRSKPSPFCVLDEVDAALDEANVGRFTSVLRDFLSSTQFLVVTHSKKTMTGADTLYGVTMQEGGISKQVSVRFEDVTDDGFIRPSAMLRAEGKKAA